MEVLDRIENTLRQSLERAAEPVLPAGPPAADGALGALGALEERLVRLQGRLAQAATDAAAADAALADTIDDLRRWLGVMQAARERLTPPVNPPARP
jgi:hypothetical protein